MDESSCSGSTRTITRSTSTPGSSATAIASRIPSEVEPPRALLWLRDRDFFENYRGKLVVFGHTTTRTLPNELSTYTPDDPTDLWAGPSCVGLDTACGKGGFLTAFELPAQRVYESRG